MTATATSSPRRAVGTRCGPSGSAQRARLSPSPRPYRRRTTNSGTWSTATATATKLSPFLRRPRNVALCCAPRARA
eukprot:6195394-Pleurochrysis_carterae.AAC.1